MCFCRTSSSSYSVSLCHRRVVCRSLCGVVCAAICCVPALPYIRNTSADACAATYGGGVQSQDDHSNETVLFEQTIIHECMRVVADTTPCTSGTQCCGWEETGPNDNKHVLTHVHVYQRTVLKTASVFRGLLSNCQCSDVFMVTFYMAWLDGTWLVKCATQKRTISLTDYQMIACWRHVCLVDRSAICVQEAGEKYFCLVFLRYCNLVYVLTDVFNTRYKVVLHYFPCENSYVQCFYISSWEDNI